MSWKIDPAHSEINFTVRHMMISNVRGRFEKFTGVVNFDEANPTASSVDVEIEAASINTREGQRDTHLKSADFLDAEKYPKLTFKNKNIQMVDANHGKITGDLTIRDISHEVVLDTEFNGKAKGPYGKNSAGFSATTTINRKDWGLVWNVGLETGGFLVGDDIKVSIELEIIEETVPEAAAQA